MIKLKNLIEVKKDDCECGGDCCSVNESKGMELGKIFTGHGFAFKKENFEESLQGGSLPNKEKDFRKIKKVKGEPDSQKGTSDSTDTFNKHHAGSLGAGDMGRIAEPDTYDWDDSGNKPNKAGHQTKKNKKRKGWEPVEESTKMTGARGLVKVPNEYVGKLGRVQYNLMKKLGYTRGGTHLIIADMHWGRNSRHSMKPNNQWSASILLKTHPYKKTKTGGYQESDLLKGDVKKVLGELMRQLRANKLRLDGKPKITGSTRYMPQIEFRVKPEQFNESVNEDGHTDVASAKRKAMVMVDDVNDLLNKLNGMNTEDSLPSWLSDKITLSQNYISKAKDYLLNPVEAKELKEDQYTPHKEIGKRTQINPNIADYWMKILFDELPPKFRNVNGVKKGVAFFCISICTIVS